MSYSTDPALDAARHYEQRARTAEAVAAAYPIATEQTLEDLVMVGEFFEEGDAIRHPSAHFGAISDPELCKLAFGENTDDASRLAAAKEIGNRMRAYFASYIERRAEEMVDA